jgi:hypothetical protein
MGYLGEESHLPGGLQTKERIYLRGEKYGSFLGPTKVVGWTVEDRDREDIAQIERVARIW